MSDLYRAYLQVTLLLALLAAGGAAQAQKAGLAIDYTVAVENPALEQFHVTTEIKNISQPRLDLNLPTWTPGWYMVENYGKNVIRFTVTDGGGKRLPLRMSRKQTWNIDTKGHKSDKDRLRLLRRRPCIELRRRSRPNLLSSPGRNCSSNPKAIETNQ